MRDLLTLFTEKVAWLHDYIVALTKQYGLVLDDLQLHFAVFGIAGFALFLVLYILFKICKPSAGFTAWLFTLLFVTLLALVVEVGQYVSGTGVMSLNDLIAGVAGFAVISLVFIALFRLLTGGGRRRKKRDR